MAGTRWRRGGCPPAVRWHRRRRAAGLRAAKRRWRRLPAATHGGNIRAIRVRRRICAARRADGAAARRAAPRARSGSRASGRAKAASRPRPDGCACANRLPGSPQPGARGPPAAWARRPARQKGQVASCRHFTPHRFRRAAAPRRGRRWPVARPVPVAPGSSPAAPCAGSSPAARHGGPGSPSTAW